jgi:hypothetical protein
MAYDLVAFKQAQSGQPVNVNPHLVRYVVKADEKTSQIVFDKDHSLVVEGAIATVSENLRKSVS